MKKLHAFGNCHPDGSFEGSGRQHVKRGYSVMNLLFVAGRSSRAVAVIAALSTQCIGAVGQPAGRSPAEVAQSKLESVLGREVTAPKGVEGGRIIDVLIDGGGDVRAYVVEFGGFLGIGTRKIAVEQTAFRFDGARIFVDVAGDQLQVAREYNVKEPLFVVKAAPRQPHR